MFAFEFALLALLTFSTSIRYAISLTEAHIIRKQTQERIQTRRAELRTARETAEREGDSDGLAEVVAEEENFDEDDIDVPGWETKGRWIFYLDLTTGTSA
jgi:E3 ubiquitin-protein ligase synoviolin